MDNSKRNSDTMLSESKNTNNVISNKYINDITQEKLLYGMNISIMKLQIPKHNIAITLTSVKSLFAVENQMFL